MLQDFWAGALGTRSKEALDLLPDTCDQNTVHELFSARACRRQ